MARIRSKMRTVELTTVSAMRSTRRELAKVARATGSTSAVAWSARSSSWTVVMVVSASAGATAQGFGML